MRGISWLAEDLLASQERLCYVQLVIIVIVDMEWNKFHRNVKV
jgi:hypothetical protein